MKEQVIPPLFKDPEADRVYESLVRDVPTYKKMKTGLEKFYKWEKKKLRDALKSSPEWAKKKHDIKEEIEFLEDFYKLEKGRLKGEKELERIWQKIRKRKILEKLSKIKIPSGTFSLDDLRKQTR